MTARDRSSFQCVAAARSPSKPRSSQVAARRACCEAPFGVQHLATFEPATAWQAERAAALALKTKTVPAIIVASDISEEAVEAARKNAAHCRRRSP